jgi:hypothetical protein
MKKDLKISNNFNRKPDYKDNLIHMPREPYQKALPPKRSSKGKEIFRP